MLTGIHAFRHKIGILPPQAPLCIPTDILTLPKLFKKAGYHTGIIGKWHLGLGSKDAPADWNSAVKPGPIEVGFDYSFLLPITNDRVPCVYLLNHHVLNLDPKDPIHIARSPELLPKNGATQYPDAKKNPEAMTYYKSSHGHNSSVINGIGRIGYMSGGKSAMWNDETMADVFVEQAKKYVKENKDKPFFLFFSSQDIHCPRTPHPRFQGKTDLGYRGDAMVQLDWSTGEIMKALEKHGLTENTIVIFSSDNGPVYDDGYDDGTVVKTSTEEVDQGHDGSGVWRGGKYLIYEGGTRVPFIVRWPGTIKPGVSDALVSQIDFIASFADMLNLKLEDSDARDSRNTMSAFLGNDPDGLPYIIEEARARLALRTGPWKYTSSWKSKNPKSTRKPQPESFYNLSTDPSEQNNIIKSHPERA
ncbi:arylsulfatase, partial [bacterium E08(2017)]